MPDSKITKKGKIIITTEVCSALNPIIDHKAVVTKVEPLDYKYHLALSNTLSEWNSPEDDNA
jgi:hypothetical protein